MSKDQHYFEIDLAKLDNKKANEEIPNLEAALTEESPETPFLEMIFPNFQIKSFAFVICSLQVFYHIIACLYFYSSNYLWECVLFFFGAGYEPAIRHNFEVHRLFFTPILLHYNFEHLATNVLFQAMILFHLENSFSKKLVIAIFFLSNLGGTILSNMVYWQAFKIGSSLSLFGCFALEIINLANQKNDIIFKSKVRFGIICVLCNVLALPILRVYDSRNKIKTNKYIKIITFYSIIIIYILLSLVISIYSGIDTEKVNENAKEDENFHWRILLNEVGKARAVFVDNLGHLG